jgi:hypothetical protein
MDHLRKVVVVHGEAPILANAIPGEKSFFRHSHHDGAPPLPLLLAFPIPKLPPDSQNGPEDSLSHMADRSLTRSGDGYVM